MAGKMTGADLYGFGPGPQPSGSMGTEPGGEAPATTVGRRGGMGDPTAVLVGLLGAAIAFAWLSMRGS